MNLQEVIPRPTDAALVVDEGGTILFITEGARRLLGHTPETLCGQSVEVLVPERFRLAHIGQRLRFTDHHRTRPLGTGLPLFALTRQGDEIPVDISLNSVQRGLRMLTVVVMRTRELVPRAVAAG